MLALATTPNERRVHAESSEIRVAATKLATAILTPDDTGRRMPLASDLEHARTIDPVMTAGAAIWIHEALPSPPLTVLGGRVFSYKDVTYHPLDAPVLKIRPIDDDQVIPFLLRARITINGVIPEGAALTVSFPAPLIFEPRIRHLRCWIGTEATEISVERRFEGVGQLHLRVPFNSRRNPAARLSDRALSVIVNGELVLGPYRQVSKKRFSDFSDLSLEQPVAALATLVVDRDVETMDEERILRSVAENIGPNSATPYDRVIAATSWVSSHLQYRQSLARRSAIEALEDRSGDCDEHTTLLLALVRAGGVPARRVTGLLYNFEALAGHAWLEVAIPKRDGTLHWFIVDPTLARTSTLEEEKATYVQYKDRILFYAMRPSVEIEGMTGRLETDVLLNWKKPAPNPFGHSLQINEFVDLVASTVDREISAGAERLTKSGNLLRRESASIPGSPYVIVDRPLAENSSNSIQLRLENEERLVLELSARAGSEVDLEAIDSLRTVYDDLNKKFFAAKPAYHNLALVYSRNQHSDRLFAISLQIGRYLVEHQLEPILKNIVKAGLLTEKETAILSAVAEVSNGRNVYLLQELARRIPTSKTTEG